MVSYANTADSGKFYFGKKTRLGSKCELKEFFTFGTKLAGLKAVRALFIKTMLTGYLIWRIKKNDTLIVYHNPGFMTLVTIMRRLKHFRLVIDVNEIYGIVQDKPDAAEKEIKFISQADGYLFASEMMRPYAAGKPYAVVNGIYEYNRREVQKKKEYDHKIHCVYSGVFQESKGVYEAIRAAEYLSQDFCMHILGFGTDEEIEHVKECIQNAEQKGKRCRIMYDGCLRGKEYTDFLKSCDIGLSTQSPDAPYNESSFPSKIFSYLSNGLRVVSIRIPAIAGSKAGRHLYYYEEQNAQQIAEAIKGIDLKDGYDAERILRNLDADYRKNMKVFLDRMMSEPDSRVMAGGR